MSTGFRITMKPQVCNPVSSLPVTMRMRSAGTPHSTSRRATLRPSPT
ncbi:MAG: hypothetical protein AAB360_02670 [Patescibacteria group bacterium]